MGLIYCIFFEIITSVYTVKLAGFLFCWDTCRFSPLCIAFCRYFYRVDILLRRRFVSETFCYRRRSVTETFCYGDVLLRRRFVWRRFVEETFCAETFCMWFSQIDSNSIKLTQIQSNWLKLSQIDSNSA
jgi:hypothetical protein